MDVQRSRVHEPTALVAFSAAVVGIVLIEIGSWRSGSLFGTGDLGHRWLIAVGGALILFASAVWWRRGRRLPALVVAAPAMIAVAVAYGSPDALFLVAVIYPLAGIVGLIAAAAGSTSSSTDRISPFYAVLGVGVLMMWATGVPGAFSIAVVAALGAGFAAYAVRARRRRDARLGPVTGSAGAARTGH